MNGFSICATVALVLSQSGAALARCDFDQGMMCASFIVDCSAACVAAFTSGASAVPADLDCAACIVSVVKQVSNGLESCKVCYGDYTTAQEYEGECVLRCQPATSLGTALLRHDAPTHHRRRAYVCAMSTVCRFREILHSRQSRCLEA